MQLSVHWLSFSLSYIYELIVNPLNCMALAMELLRGDNEVCHVQVVVSPIHSLHYEFNSYVQSRCDLTLSFVICSQLDDGLLFRWIHGALAMELLGGDNEAYHVGVVLSPSLPSNFGFNSYMQSRCELTLSCVMCSLLVW